MSFVKRYHTPVCRAFQIIKHDAQDLGDEEALRTEVKPINDSVEPDGLVPTLLVYGTVLRLSFPRDKSASDTHQGVAALQKVTEEISIRFA